MKADADAWVHVPGIAELLRRYNATEPAYLGTLTYSHGPSFEKWEPFAHGLGYILSRGALRTSSRALKDCLLHLANHRLDSIEDMVLASCIRRVHVYPKDI